MKHLSTERQTTLDVVTMSEDANLSLREQQKETAKKQHDVENKSDERKKGN